ncbi:MAG: DivIVA domain-containing protein [Syntrophomonadaceae bacterium]|nr:DivIVA domain-containing protein [Syntrophomonadaceae bacterium]
MITSNEIRSKRFNKSFRGFNQEEAKQFLVTIADDYEQMYSDNANLRDRIKLLEEDLKKYHRIEDTMNNCLILAQQTAETVKEQANNEAALLMKEYKHKISEMLMIYQEIIKRLNLFNSELKSNITGHLEMIEKNSRKINEMSDFFYNSDMKNVLENLEKLELTEQ